MRPSRPSFTIAVSGGEAKFKELILYIATRCKDDYTFGLTKLYKMLWWADFLAYAKLGEPLTGLAYRNLPHGPAPTRFKELHRTMKLAGRSEIRELPAVGGKMVRKVVMPLDDPDMSLFSTEQIAIAEEAIREYADLTATEASEKSHGLAWRIAGDRNAIPYEAVFLSDNPIAKVEESACGM